MVCRPTRQSLFGTPRGRGFTLVELLVVIGVIALLISILMPALSRSREMAKRIVCLNRLKQINTALMLYGNMNKQWLPPGSRDNDNGEHCIWISDSLYNYLVKSVGTFTNMDQPVGTVNGDVALTCPDMEEQHRPFHGAVGWVIGYNYLGGHPGSWNGVKNAPMQWYSPLRLSEKGDYPVFCDLNDWSPPDGWTVAPHLRSRAGGFFYIGKKPKEVGAEGGNVAYLDGSARWSAITDMKEHATYNGSGTAYMGMW